MLKMMLSDVRATENLARTCAEMLPPSVVILLGGPLGAGKTVFARAFIRALMADENYTVASPTFNLVHPHQSRHGVIYHYDLYRVENVSELDELGFDDVTQARATLIEWPDRLPEGFRFGAAVVRIEIDVMGGDRRSVKIDLNQVMAMPETAFVFAAGLGERMRPLTDCVPKPLVKVAGQPILAYTFASLKEAGFKKLFMNTHYLPEQVNDFADMQKQDFNITIFHEDTLLETGGGMLNALPMIRDDVFFATNGDALIVDQPGDLPYPVRLTAQFDPDKMDILLLLYPVGAPSITPVIGDYHMDDAGRLTRAKNRDGAYMFASARILHRRVFAGRELERFSFLELMDQAQEQGRLFGLVHKGEWHHLSTPDDVLAVSDYLQGKGQENAA